MEPSKCPECESTLVKSGQSDQGYCVWCERSFEVSEGQCVEVDEKLKEVMTKVKLVESDYLCRAQKSVQHRKGRMV